MCEREKGLIGNYFSESSLTTEHMKLLDMLGSGRQEPSVKRGDNLVSFSAAWFLSKAPAISISLYFPLQWRNSCVLQLEPNPITSRIKNP